MDEYKRKLIANGNVKLLFIKQRINEDITARPTRSKQPGWEIE